MRAWLVVAGVVVFFIGAVLPIAMVGVPIAILGIIMVIWGAVTSGKAKEIIYMPPKQTVYPQTPQYASPTFVASQYGPADTKFCQFCGMKMMKTGSFCPACGRQQP